MRKVLLISGIVIVLLVSAIITIPIIFKKQIIEIAQNEINKNINANVKFDGIKLSLIKHFPDLTVSLNKLCITGRDTFKLDTLVKFKKFSVSVDIFKLINGNIVIKSFFLDNPSLNAHILKNGEANYDIISETEDTDTVVTSTTDTSEIHIKLNKFIIKDAKIIYNDESSAMYAYLDNFNLRLKGDFSESTSLLNIEMKAEKLDFVYESIKYLNSVIFSFKSIVDANLDKMSFTLKENEIKLNQFAISLDGSVSMPGDTIITDILFTAAKTDFKTLLSLIPAVYQKDFEDINTTGNIIFNGYIKGQVIDSIIPDVELRLIVDKASFSYPDLPKKVENININLVVFNDGTNDNNSFVDIQKFHLDIAQNPIDIKMQIKSFAIDPHIDGNIKMKIDLESLKDAIPLEDIKISGKINGDLTLNGAVSSIENEKYQDFSASGAFNISNVLVKMPDLPADLIIKTSVFNFTSKYLELASFESKLGESDLKLQGKVENYIPYVLSDGILKADLNLMSDYINVDELMNSDTTQTVSEQETPITEDTTSTAAFEIPNNLNIVFNSNIKNLKYDKLNITNFKGLIRIESGKAYLDKINMNAMEGTILLKAFYDPSEINKPKANINIELNEIDIPSAYNSFNTVKKLAPISKHCEGKITVKLDFSSILDNEMSPLLKTIDGSGYIQSKTIGIKNSETINQIADLLKNDRFRNPYLNDFKALLKIKNGQIEIEPFKANLAGQQTEISGKQGIDRSIDYLVKLTIPRSQFSGAAAEVLNMLSNNAIAKGLSISNNENINVNLNFTGFLDKPKVSFSLGEFKSGFDLKEQVVNKVKEDINKKVDIIKEDVKEKAKAEADKLINEAEKEAAKIKDEAKKLADQVRKEGDIAAQKIIDEAKNKNILAKNAAKVMADKTKKEAEAKATKIEQEANQKADQLIKEAKAKASKLL
jgi:hypothetical protein